MANPPDYMRKKYGPLQEKTLCNALSHRIHQEFPRIGGPRMRQLCAEMILEVVDSHLRAQSTVRHGQTLWMAVSVDDPPRRHQRIQDTDLVPVVLDLSTAEDVQRRLERVLPGERLQAKALRLCRQAYEQGGLLSNCDLAELLSTNDSRIATLLAAYERETQQIVPRRATLHDVGTGLTHKAIICWKRYAEGKETVQIAQETRHSLEAVDRYLGQYDRVHQCHKRGMTAHETAHLLACSVGLVEQYLEIERRLEDCPEDPVAPEPLE